MVGLLDAEAGAAVIKVRRERARCYTRPNLMERFFSTLARRVAHSPPNAEHILSHLRASRRPTPTQVAVTGRSGVGKTALVHHACCSGACPNPLQANTRSPFILGHSLSGCPLLVSSPHNTRRTCTLTA